MQEPTYISLNGKVVSWGEGRVHLWTDTAQRGMNVFDALRAFYDPERNIFRILCFDEHCRRLLRSSAALGFPDVVDVVGLREALSDLICALRLQEHLYIRPTIFIEKGGYERNPANIRAGYYIVVVPIESSLDKIRTISAAISRYRKVPCSSFPASIKTGAMYGLTRLARLDAEVQGADEALLLNENGHITETPGANIFIVSGGILHTPPLSDGILDGITRSNIISLARQHSLLEVREESITVDHAHAASEAFVCGTLAQITGLSRIDGHLMNSVAGPMSAELSKLYRAICQGEEGMEHPWISLLDPSAGHFI